MLHSLFYMTVIFLPSYVHFYTIAPYVCNAIVISVFKALQKHQLTTHDNYNYNFVIFAYTRPHIGPK